MFTNLIVGFDASPGSEDALALAFALADPHASIVVATVVDPAKSVSPNTPSSVDWAGEDPRVQFVSAAAPSPAAGLHRLADEISADLLVVGSSKAGRLHRLVAGDDTRATLRGAPCAVAIAPPGYARHAAPISVIGVGCDDSGSCRAVAVARQLRASRAGTLKALAVVAAPDPMLAPGTYPHVDARTGLQRAQRRLAQLDGVAAEARFGEAAPELAAWSQQLDLLVLGATTRGIALRLLLGSVPEQLARRLSSPLLVVPRDAKNAETPQASSASSAAPAA